MKYCPINTTHRTLLSNFMCDEVEIHVTDDLFMSFRTPSDTGMYSCSQKLNIIVRFY